MSHAPHTTRYTNRPLGSSAGPSCRSPSLMATLTSCRVFSWARIFGFEHFASNILGSCTALSKTIGGLGNSQASSLLGHQNQGVARQVFGGGGLDGGPHLPVFRLLLTYYQGRGRPALPRQAARYPSQSPICALTASPDGLFPVPRRHSSALLGRDCKAGMRCDFMRCDLL